MSQLGIGAMLHYLSGGNQTDVRTLVGRKIVEASFDSDDGLTLKFDGGEKYRLWDNGQSCCESRYASTDDRVEDLVGGVLQSIESKKHEDGEMDYGVHEQVFVEVRTDKTTFTMVNHNEHNGYYGGFGLTITKE